MGKLSNFVVFVIVFIFIIVFVLFICNVCGNFLWMIVIGIGIVWLFGFVDIS